MSYRRIFSLRELALCLVILANAIGLGAVILTTAMATSPALASVDAESSEDTAAGVIERVDQGRIGADASDADSDTTIPQSKSYPDCPRVKSRFPFRPAMPRLQSPPLSLRNRPGACLSLTLLTTL